jgi:hypothetical protein
LRRSRFRQYGNFDIESPHNGTMMAARSRHIVFRPVSARGTTARNASHGESWMLRCLLTIAVLGACFTQGRALAERNWDGKIVSAPRCQGAPQCLPTFIARLDHAPYPIDKNDDGTGKRFFRSTKKGSGARVRIMRDGERYPEPNHYSDPSVLFHIPRHFDRRKPFRLVVFFHSHDTALDPGILNSGLLGQVDASRANVILIVPQLAYRADDSHPGKLIRPGGLGRMLNEAADILARTLGKDMKPRLANAPIVLMAFSGGDQGLAAGLKVSKDPRAGTKYVERIEGVVLLEAIFEQERRIDAWLKQRVGQVFLVALYGKLSARWTRRLVRRWKGSGIRYRRSLPDRIGRGSVVVIRVDTEHAAIIDEGPPRNPITEILSRLPPPH